MSLLCIEGRGQRAATQRWICNRCITKMMYSTYKLSLFRKCKKPSHRTIVKRCCYITVDSTTLQTGACTNRCISKQMHYVTTLFTQRLHEKSGILKTTLLFSVWKKTTFLTIQYLLRTMHGI